VEKEEREYRDASKKTRAKKLLGKKKLSRKRGGGQGGACIKERTSVHLRKRSQPAKKRKSPPSGGGLGRVFVHRICERESVPFMGKKKGEVKGWGIN